MLDTLSPGTMSRAALMVCIALASYFVVLSRTWEDDSLANWAAVTGILAFLVGLAIYLHQLHREEKERAQRELKDRMTAIGILLWELYSNLKVIKSADSKKTVDLGQDGLLTYTSWHLYDHSYKSVISGGQIPFIAPELRQSIADVYIMIDAHNYYLRYLFEWMASNRSGDVSDILDYYKALAHDEGLLAEKIPALIQKLREVEASLS